MGQEHKPQHIHTLAQFGLRETLPPLTITQGNTKHNISDGRNAHNLKHKQQHNKLTQDGLRDRRNTHDVKHKPHFEDHII